MVEAGFVIFLGVIVFGTLYAVSAAIFYYCKFTFWSKNSTTSSTNPTEAEVEGTS